MIPQTNENQHTIRRFVATIFDRNMALHKVNITFIDSESVTLTSVWNKVSNKLNTDQFTLLAWSSVDEFAVN